MQTLVLDATAAGAAAGVLVLLLEMLLLCRQLQAGYSSTEQSKQFSFVATAKTVCTKWKQFDNKQIERLGD